MSVRANNFVSEIGRVTDDANLKPNHTYNGKKSWSLFVGLAIHMHFTDQNGQRQQRTNFICMRDFVNSQGSYNFYSLLKKGKLISVLGHLQGHQWTTTYNGKKYYHYRMDLIPDSITIFSRKNGKKTLAKAPVNTTGKVTVNPKTGMKEVPTNGPSTNQGRRPANTGNNTPANGNANQGTQQPANNNANQNAQKPANGSAPVNGNANGGAQKPANGGAKKPANGGTQNPANGKRPKVGAGNGTGNGTSGNKKIDISDDDLPF